MRYCEKGLHASGNPGDVYEADDLELERVVALKRLQPARTSGPSHRAQFLLEGEITGRLEHPGIVPVYGLGKTPAGDDYYAMRLIRGQTFWDAIQSFHNARARLDPGERPRARGMGALPALADQSAVRGTRVLRTGAGE
jgi:serine/threonine protein kinase